MNCRLFLSIPHIAFLFDMRKHPRYKPLDGLSIVIETEGHRIDGQLLDICMGGMRILSTGESIEDSKNISLTTDDFSVNLPCRSMRKIDCYYGIRFGEMDGHVYSNLEYFIDKFTKKPRANGPTEIMR